MWELKQSYGIHKQDSFYIDKIISALEDHKKKGFPEVGGDDIGKILWDTINTKINDDEMRVKGKAIPHL